MRMLRTKTDHARTLKTGMTAMATKLWMLTETAYATSSRLLAARIQRLVTTTQKRLTDDSCKYAENVGMIATAIAWRMPTETVYAKSSRSRVAEFDAAACNYNADATDEDGSCTYAEDGYDCDGTAWQMLTETAYATSSRLLAARIQRLATTTQKRLTKHLIVHLRRRGLRATAPATAWQKPTVMAYATSSRLRVVTGWDGLQLQRRCHDQDGRAPTLTTAMTATATAWQMPTVTAYATSSSSWLSRCHCMQLQR